MAEPLDPSAAERVIRRANELADGDEHRDGIEPAALIEAALDVGIPEKAIRQSLALERIGPAPQPQRLDRLVGPAIVAEQRVLGAGPDEVLDLLDRWLVKRHHLRRVRRRTNDVEWARRDDPLAGARRAVSGVSGNARLGTAPRVRATAHSIDETDTVLRVSVDRSGTRRTALVSGGLFGATGIACATVGIVATAPIVFAAIPTLAASGYVMASAHKQAGRFDDELGRVLDAVAEQQPPSRVRRSRRRC